MVNVTFLPNNQTVRAQRNTSVLELAREYEIDLNADCQGAGNCYKCKVMVSKGNDRIFTKKELEGLTKEEQEKGYRLGCEMKVKEDTCIIIPRKQQQIRQQINPQRKEKKQLGVAMDIGTTTIALELFDEKKKERIASSCFFNPQSIYGSDIISRISYCYQNESRVSQLKSVLIKRINQELKTLLHQIGQEKDSIECIVIAANTAMSQFIMGESIDRIAKAPVTPSFLSTVIFSAHEKGFFCGKNTKGILLPSIGGYVGGDALACFIAEPKMMTEKVCLLIDIGTNTELILKTKKSISTCSTAAGPAFEGAVMRDGMVAANGAIYKMQQHNGKFKIDTIGGGEPIGICGSGYIDAIAEAYKYGYIDHTGYITSKDSKIFICNNQKGMGIYLTQEDIRQFQLAKAAIRAAIDLLLLKCNISFEQVEELVIAGSFGKHLTLENAFVTGLLPKKQKEQVTFMGNGSLKGAAVLLLGKISTLELDEIQKKLQYMELSNDPAFQTQFIKNMNF